MVNQKFHICILVSGHVFEHPYGEENYANLLSNWLGENSYGVTLIGRGGLCRITHKHFLGINSRNEKPVIQNTKLRKTRNFIGSRYISYGLRPLMSLLFIFRIILIHKKYPLDLIHAQDTGYAGLAAIISSRILKIPCIITSHSIRHKILDSTTPTLLKKLGFIKFEYLLDIFTLKHTDFAIAVNLSMKKYFEQRINKVIEFLPNPIKFKNFVYSEEKRKSVMEELGIEDDNITVGYIGRLTEEKNLFTLIRAFKSLTRENGHLRLILIGDGPIKDRLVLEVKSLSIQDKVIFTGVRSDISRLLSVIDIFVLPSFTEGWSTVLMEAMACGRAIVCSNIDANQGIITNEKTGLLANPNNQLEFIHHIQSLCDNTTFRLQLGQTARKEAECFDVETIFPQICKIYEIVLGKKQ